MSAPTPATTTLPVFIGTRTTRERNARGEGIGVGTYDTATGQLRLAHIVRDLVNPSYLALSRDGRRLYTVHGDGSSVSLLRPRSDGGGAGGQTWHCVQTLDAALRNPVHLALDAEERHMVVSSHLTGELVVLPLAADGALQAPVQRVALPGEPGPHRKEQPFSKPHFNPFDASGRWVLVPDKGLDRVFSFAFADGRLHTAAQPHIASREGAGPRNLAFHPHRPWAYVVNELDSSVTTCDFDADSGALTARQIVPSLPDTFTGNSRAAGIAVHPGGRFLYASNRGHDSIALFHIDPASGHLRFVQAFASGGRTPRFFAIAPDGRFLLALNEDSDSIHSFAIDADSGRLSPAAEPLAFGSPVCLLFGE